MQTKRHTRAHRSRILKSFGVSGQYLSKVIPFSVGNRRVSAVSSAASRAKPRGKCSRCSHRRCGLTCWSRTHFCGPRNHPKLGSSCPVTTCRFACLDGEEWYSATLLRRRFYSFPTAVVFRANRQDSLSRFCSRAVSYSFIAGLEYPAGHGWGGWSKWQTHPPE